MTRSSNNAKLENRLDNLMKKAKPAPATEQTAGPEMASHRSRSLPLILAFLTVLLLFSVTQVQPKLPMITGPIAEIDKPTIQPAILIDTDKPLTIVVAQPGTVFFCGCTHTRTRTIDAFAKQKEISEI